MNRRIFLQLSGPAAIVGFLLFGASLASVWSIHRLQRNQASILVENVASLELSQELVISLRQFRFHTLMNLMDPRPLYQELIDQDHVDINRALSKARESSSGAPEHALVDEIERGYVNYRKVVEKSERPIFEDTKDVVAWIENHKIKPLLEPCYDLLKLNKTMMGATARENDSLAKQTWVAVLLLGIVGPISGLIVGYVVARAWSRSIARLNVRLNDMHAHLDSDLGEVNVDFGGDLEVVDRQLDRVAQRVKEAADQLQQQQKEILRSEQLAAVGQLAASVAHEIRNPLTAIKMLIGAALRPGRPQPLTEPDLKVMYDEVGKLETTVQTLLDYAKPQDLRRTRVDIRTVLEKAVNLVRAKSQQHDVQVDVQVPDDEVPTLVDPGHMGTVFVNLLMNSLDAMPTGGSIQIDCRLLDGEVTVEVSDTGPGVPPSFAPRIFDPFASGKPTGTGLGLSICQRVIREHGGSIHYHPRPGGGSCFVVTLRRFIDSPEEVADAAIAGRR
jgi:two-component system sensor histidine kinase HydH